MTFNINKGSQHEDWKQELVEIVKESSVDIVLLQEANSSWGKNGFYEEYFPNKDVFVSKDNKNIILVKKIILNKMIHWT